MRDVSVNDKNYFKEFLEKKEKLIQESNNRILKGTIPEENIPEIMHKNFVKKIEMLIANYSAGESIDTIKNSYLTLLKSMKLGWEDNVVKFQKGRTPKRIMLDKYFLMPYNYMIWLLSLAILLKVSEKEINILKELIEKANIRDKLIICLLSFLTPIYSTKKLERTTVKPFSGLIKPEKMIDTDKQMKSYLDKWYQNTKLLMWHNYNAESGKHFYYGRWSFESAALVVMNGIDDNSFRDNKYYPKDLVDYYRANQTT